MQLVITQEQLSDLFFNYDNVNYSNACSAAAANRQRGLTDAEIRDALEKDAADFALCYGTHEDVSKEELAAWLVNDFIHRL